MASGIIGNNYAIKTDIYGGFPGNLLERIAAPMYDRQCPLHLFAGKVDLSVLRGDTLGIHSLTPGRRQPNSMAKAIRLFAECHRNDIGQTLVIGALIVGRDGKAQPECAFERMHRRVGARI
jgi:hypothetical protein